MSVAQARGPLGILVQSTSAQVATLGAGTLYMFPEKFNEVVLPSLSAVLGADLSQFRLVSDSSANSAAGSVPSSIVIHTSNDASGRKTIMVTLLNWTIGAAVVWLAFGLMSGYLPENVKAALPVTRNIFDKTSQKLADSLTTVKDVLGKQLVKLRYQQDELNEKQEKTHEDVKHIKGEMGHAREELLSLLKGVDSCHDRLDESNDIQTYTARGVKLLAKCVASIMPGDDRIVSELERYQRGGGGLRITQIDTPDKDAPETPMASAAIMPPPSAMRTPAARDDDDHKAVERLLNSGRISVQ